MCNNHFEKDDMNPAYGLIYPIVVAIIVLVLVLGYRIAVHG